MVAIYKIINTVVYNQNEPKSNENSEFLNIPAKYKNFQKELQTIVAAYREILTQENIINLLNLL